MITIILSLFSFLSAHANELCHENIHPELNDLAQLEKAIDWTAASDSQIRNAPCIRKKPFTEDEMKSWMASNDSTPKMNKTINGISFENESFENLEGFRHLTTFVDILGEKDPEKHKDFTSSCKKVECAVKEIFGNDTGLQLLYMQRRYGLNGSHVIKNETEGTSWKKSELDTVLLALSDFPDGVLPIEDSRTMIHAPRNYGNGRTIANAIITIFQLWNTQTPEQQRSTIVHELGHAIAGVSDLDDHDHWTHHSGWSATTKIVDGFEKKDYKSTNPDSIISKYGMTNPHEDFAESVVAYRYNPQALKEASPGKYKVIKEAVFDNVEYTSQQACSNPERLSHKYVSELTHEISSWKPSEPELKEISNRCSRLTIETLAAEFTVDLGTSEFQNCYNRSVLAQTKEYLKTKIENHPEKDFLAPMLRNASINLPPDLLSSIAESAKNFHRVNLREQLTEGLKDRYFCDPTQMRYSYQYFKEEKLGIKSYSLKDQLTEISKEACRKKETASREAVAASMIK